MKYFIWKIVCMLLLLTTYQAFAQEPQSLEQLGKTERNVKKAQELDEAIKAIDNLDYQINKMMGQRDLDCEKAIGYKPFCDCILKELPIAWSFSDYIAITTGTKEANQYAKLDQEMKMAYDKVGPIRDRCVIKINKKN